MFPELDLRDPDLRAFLSITLVGPCPKCGRLNSHDCEPEKGITCSFAYAIKDSLANHCDDCNALWCDMCGKIVIVEDPDLAGQKWSSHFAVCGLEDREITLIFNSYEGLQDKTGLKCSICRGQLEEGFEVYKLPFALAETVESVLGEDDEFSLVCSSCLPRFCYELKKQDGIKVRLENTN